MDAKESGSQGTERFQLFGKGPGIRYLAFHAADCLRGEDCLVPDTAKGTGKRGIPAVYAGIGQGNAGVPLQKDVILGFCYLAAYLNPQFRYIHMDRITQADTFRCRDVRISRCLPQL